MKLLSKLAILVGLLTCLTLTGCGGHGGGAPGHGGSAKINIYWPPRTRVIPDNADSITVSAYTRLRSDITQTLTPIPGVQPQTVNRPFSGSGSTTIVFNGDLPQTSNDLDVVLVANAYAGSNPTPLASGSTVLSVTAGQTTPFNITLETTITDFKAVVTNGGAMTTYDLATSPNVTIALDSASTVQFQAFDADGNQVLVQESDLTITPTDVLMVEGKQSPAKGSDTVTVSALHPGSGTLQLSYSQASGSLFSPVSLSLFVNPVSKTLSSTFIQSTSEQFTDIASKGSVVYGAFVPGTSFRALDFSQGVPDFTDASSAAWTNSGSSKIALGGVGSDRLYVGDSGAASLAEVLSASTSAITLSPHVVDMDAKSGTHLFVLTSDQTHGGRQTVLSFDGSGSQVSGEKVTTTVNSTNGSVAVTPATYATAGPKNAVYISGGNSVHRFIGGVNDPNFRFTLDVSGASVTDIAADGLLLYVLDSTGTLTIGSWDGTPVGTVDLSSIVGDTVTLLRVAAADGSIYVSFISQQGTDSFYGVARVQ